MILAPKHNNLKDQYKTKERVKNNFISGATCLCFWLLNDITFRRGTVLLRVQHIYFQNGYTDVCTICTVVVNI
jgi:hypothetical protein